MEGSGNFSWFFPSLNSACGSSGGVHDGGVDWKFLATGLGVHIVFFVAGLLALRVSRGAGIWMIGAAVARLSLTLLMYFSQTWHKMAFVYKWVMPVQHTGGYFLLMLYGLGVCCVMVTAVGIKRRNAELEAVLNDVNQL